MATQKTSVSLDVGAIAAAKRAAEAEGVSLSAFLSQLIRERVKQDERFEAMARFLHEHAPTHKLSERSRRAIEAEWSAPLQPVRARGRRKRGAA